MLMKEVDHFFFFLLVFCQRWCTTERFCTGVFRVYVFTNKYTQTMFCRLQSVFSVKGLPHPTTQKQAIFINKVTIQ